MIGGGLAGVLTAWELKQRGVERAGLYYRLNAAEVERLKELCRRFDAPMEGKTNFVYSLDRRKLDRELDAFQKLGIPAIFDESPPLPLSAAGAVDIPGQAQYHPLKLASPLAKELTIYENSKVTELIGTTAKTEHGRIRSKKIVVATHFPFLNKHGSYFLKLYQHRSYLLALENAGALDAMSLDGIPYIGQYSRNTPDLYVAAGFYKWGMTGFMVSAMLLTDLLHGK